MSDFDGLHSNRHNEEAQLYAFDLPALDGADLRDLPLFDRKDRDARRLSGLRVQIFSVIAFIRGFMRRPPMPDLPHPDLLAATVSCSGTEITIQCNDHDVKDRLMDWLTGEKR